MTKTVKNQGNKCMIDGVVYDTLKQGADSLGISSTALYCRFEAPAWPNCVRWKAGDSMDWTPRDPNFTWRKGKLKKVLCNGLVYNSCVLAAEATDVEEGTLRYQLHAKNFPNVIYWKEGDSTEWIKRPGPSIRSKKFVGPKPLSSHRRRNSPARCPVPRRPGFNPPPWLQQLYDDKEINTMNKQTLNKIEKEWKFLTERYNKCRDITGAHYYPKFEYTLSEWATIRDTLLHKHLYGLYDENNAERENWLK